MNLGLIEIDHGLGVFTYYLHNEELKKAVGDKVEAGEVIALAGGRGSPRGVHLHFSISVVDENHPKADREKSSVDPEKFIWTWIDW